MKIKPLICVIMALFIAISAAGCSKTTGTAVTNSSKDADTFKTVSGKEVSADDPRTMLFLELGCGIFTPEEWTDENYPGLVPTILDDSFSVSYLSKDMIEKYEDVDAETMDDEEIIKIFESAIPFFKIFYVEKGDDKSAKKNSSSYEHMEKIVDFDKKSYYLAYNDTCPDDKNNTYSDESIAEFKELASTIDAVKDGIIIFPLEKQDDEIKDFTSLEAKKVNDMNGNPFTSKDFEKYDMTMINIWATWCGPCVGELPDIEKVYKSLPENVNMITICTDGEDELDSCKKILKDSGATFTTLAGNKALDNSLLSGITAFPTTVFVDSEGNLIGEPVMGANKASFYLNEIDKHLKLIKK